MVVPARADKLEVPPRGDEHKGVGEGEAREGGDCKEECSPLLSAVRRTGAVTDPY